MVHHVSIIIALIYSYIFANSGTERMPWKATLILPHAVGNTEQVLYTWKSKSRWFGALKQPIGFGSAPLILYHVRDHVTGISST